MICPKCKLEQPDTAKFCSQCAARLAHSGWRLLIDIAQWLSLVLAFVLATMGFFLWRANERAIVNMRKAASASTAEHPQPPTPQPHSVNLTNGAATVNATSYTSYKFVVPENVSEVAVTGHFVAAGGTGNDIDCYILDEDGFVNLKNRHTARTYYNSGRVTQAKILASKLSPGTYYIMLDNRFSLLTPKAVQIEATLSYVQ